MVDGSRLRDVREEEKALLRRCRAFILGGPDTPGGGPEDIVYLTPDGRWFRVCDVGLLDECPDRGREGVEWLSSTAVGKLFDDYGVPRPPELDRNRRWDSEICPSLLSSMYTDQFEPMSARELKELDSLERLGDKATVAQSYRRSSLEAMRSRKPKRRPAKVQSFEEYCQEMHSGAFIRRNALLDRLQRWSREWPGAAHELAPVRTHCQANVVRTLDRAGTRLSKTKLHGRMTNKRRISLSHLMASLKRLNELGLVDNDRSGTAKGYGLTDRGREVAGHIPTDGQDQ
jgi:hypothetical protein